MPVLRENVGMDAHSVVDDWDAAPFDGGFGGIDALASRGFSGAIEADGTWLFLRDGEALAVVADLDVDPRPGDIDAFEGASGRQYEAPTAGVATVAAMVALGGEVRGTYFTDDTPLSAVDETLSGGGFTGYVELSENVLSGDYYYAYVDGAVEHVAFVGSEQLLTGEEAESRAEGEVGIYDVVAVELPRPELPEPESPPEPDPTPTATGGETDAEADSEADSEAGRYGGAADSEPKRSSGADAAAETDGETGIETDADAEAEIETDADAGSAVAAGSDTKADAEASADPDANGGTAPEVDTSWLESDAETDDADTEPDADADMDADADTDADAETGDFEPDADVGTDDAETGGFGDRADTDTEGEADTHTGGDDGPPDDRSGVSTVAAVTDDGDDAGTDDAGGTSAAEAATKEQPTGTDGAEPEGADGEGEDESRVDREAHDAEIERYESRIEELEAELDAADSRIEALEAELDSLRAERDDLRRRAGSAGDTAGEPMAPEAALPETRLFVRQRTRGEGTLSDAHEGADREAVVSNLRIEYHTTFDDAGVSVEGEPFEAWLRASDAYAFAEWLATELLFEIRSAGRPEEVRPLYDALPEIDRIGFEETIAVGDGTEGREVGFDIVARDKSGHPLVVAAFDRGRDPTYADAIEPFVDDATDVCADHDTLAGAVAITSSYFESDAMAVVHEATSSSLLSRSRYRSYVKLSRTNGYHLCLVEAREGSFNLTVPEL